MDEFPKFHLFEVPRPIKAVGRWLGHAILGPHLFSPISDHEFRHDPHPFDAELYNQLGETSEGVGE